MDELDGMAERWEDEPTQPYERLPRGLVLVVEDDDALRGVIAAHLERDGFDVVDVASGDRALAVLEKPPGGEPFQLVIMDVRMPGTSGFDTAHRIRVQRRTTPVLLITAFPDTELLNNAARLGVSLLAKPFALSQLTDAAISSIVSGMGPPALRVYP